MQVRSDFALTGTQILDDRLVCVSLTIFVCISKATPCYDDHDDGECFQANNSDQTLEIFRCVVCAEDLTANCLL